jgi:nicotinamidase/pyrazinamidase
MSHLFGARTALILVDLQNDFCPGGALAVPQGNEVVPIANALQGRFRTVVASQDWHPAEHLSFAVNHQRCSVGDSVELEGFEQILWPVHCVQDSHGAAFHPDLELSNVDAVFQKGTDPGIDSYSAFFDNGHRQGTGLKEYLGQREVTDVYLLGLTTDYCVKYSALDANDMGLRTYVIEDGCRAVNLFPRDGQKALDEMRSKGVRIIQSSSLSS